jgi:predicted TIM-barrel fold metal-dependent hydrolase
MTTATRLRFIDADGHLLEHPSEMVRYAPKGYEDRIWHVETDAAGEEWIVMNGARLHANTFAVAGTAGMSDEDRQRALLGEIKYTEVAPASYTMEPRLADMTRDGIDVSVLYPTLMLYLVGYPDLDFAEIMCRAYNDWLSDYTAESGGRLYGAAAVPQHDPERAAREIRRAARLPGIKAVFLRPNPTSDWKHFNDAVYDPIWQAVSDTGLAIGLHPAISGDIPGAIVGLRVNHLAHDSLTGRGDLILPPSLPGGVGNFDNIAFTQAIGSPVDMMTSMMFVLMGGVCERFPELRIAFLEANGGWVVPWLERLDHHAKEFFWDVPWLKMRPSDYFRRQCWISFDPDESALAFTANSPLVGAERIVWASDYPHPDAKFPGMTAELARAMEPLGDEQRLQIAGGSAHALYRLDD